MKRQLIGFISFTILLAFFGVLCAEESVTYTGRGGINYTVVMGADPTSGVSGIKFEDGEPGLGEDKKY